MFKDLETEINMVDDRINNAYRLIDNEKQFIKIMSARKLGLLKQLCREYVIEYIINELEINGKVCIKESIIIHDYIKYKKTLNYSSDINTTETAEIRKALLEVGKYFEQYALQQFQQKSENFEDIKYLADDYSLF